MTIIESDAWQGLEIGRVRPYVPKVRMLQQLKTVAEDQAFVHKSMLGQAVPNAPGSAVAADHNHNGTLGVPLTQFGIVHIPLGAVLPAGASSGGWQPICRQVIRALPGVHTYRVMVFTGNPEAVLANGVRVVRYDTSMNVVEGTASWQPTSHAGLVPGLHSLSMNVGVDDDATQVIAVECWNGAFGNNGGPISDTRTISCVVLQPYAGEPHAVFAHLDPASLPGTVYVPLATQHLGAYPFTSFDDAMFDDDRSVNAFLVQSLVKNDAYLYERATDLAAATNSDSHTNGLRYRGHSHGDSLAGVGSTARLGVDVDMALMCAHWGVGCEPPGVAGGHLAVDQPDPSDNTWTGRIHAPTIRNSSTSYEVVDLLPVQLPYAQTSHYGTSGKLRVAALVYLDTAKSATGKVRLTMTDDEGGSPSASPTVVNVSTNGWHVVTSGAVDISGTGNGEELQHLQVEIKQDTAAVTAMAIGSCCMWYEA